MTKRRLTVKINDGKIILTQPAARVLRKAIHDGRINGYQRDRRPCERLAAQGLLIKIGPMAYQATDRGRTALASYDALPSLSLAEHQVAAVRRNIEKAHEVNRAKTHCPNGHAYTAESVVKGGRRRCTICAREMWKRTAASGNISPIVIRRVIDAANEGKTLNEIGGWRGQNYVGGFIVKPERLRIFMRENHKIGKRLQKLFDANRAAARAASSQRIIAAPAVLRNNGIDIFAAIEQATHALHESIRDDVMGSMFIAASEGRLKPSEIQSRVREFVTAHNRMFSQYVPNGGGIMRSLDQQLFDDGPLTLGDTVTQGLWG